MLNAVMIKPYIAFKEYTYNTFGDTILSRPVGLFIASLIGTALVLPFDNMRTRIMAQHKNPSLNRLNYSKSFAESVSKVILHEGYLSFYAGSWAFFLQTFIYSWTTLYICDKLESRVKK